MYILTLHHGLPTCTHAFRHEALNIFWQLCKHYTVFAPRYKSKWAFRSKYHSTSLHWPWNHILFRQTIPQSSEQIPSWEIYKRLGGEKYLHRSWDSKFASTFSQLNSEHILKSNLLNMNFHFTFEPTSGPKNFPTKKCWFTLTDSAVIPLIFAACFTNRIVHIVKTTVRQLRNALYKPNCSRCNDNSRCCQVSLSCLLRLN